MNYLAGLIFAVLWLYGVVLVKGFWLIVTAIVIPPFAWYKAAEHIAILNGWI